MKLVIRKKDNYNFILADKLDEPKIYTMAGKDIISNYENKDLFYGRLGSALRGLFKHSKVKIPFIPEELDLVKPSGQESLYDDWIDLEIKEVIERLSDGQ